MGEEEYEVSVEALSEASAEEITIDMSSQKNPEIEKALGVFSNPNATEAEHEIAAKRLVEAMGLAPSGEPTESEKIAMISIETTQTPTAPEGWHQRDSFSEWVEIWKGWPISNRETGKWVNQDGIEVPPPAVPRHIANGDGIYHETEESYFWPVHCYGMVGVGRSYSPDTGSGAELYTVIGHAPRHLDRNIALVGRVIEGMEHLSSLPRGSGALGFYTQGEAEKRVPILSIRVASDLAEEAQPASSSEAVGSKYAFEYLSTESESFATYAEARANRRDPFFIQPAGGADICNIPVPIRRVKSAQ
jgi:peptidylprolyl isomerase